MARIIPQVDYPTPSTNLTPEQRLEMLRLQYVDVGKFELIEAFQFTELIDIIKQIVEETANGENLGITKEETPNEE